MASESARAGGGWPMLALVVLLREETGASMAEYALLVALIALACVGAVGSFGRGIQALFETAIPFPFSQGN